MDWRLGDPLITHALKYYCALFIEHINRGGMKRYFYSLSLSPWRIEKVLKSHCLDSITKRIRCPNLGSSHFSVHKYSNPSTVLDCCQSPLCRHIIIKVQRIKSCFVFRIKGKKLTRSFFAFLVIQHAFMMSLWYSAWNEVKLKFLLTIWQFTGESKHTKERICQFTIDRLRWNHLFSR